MYFVLNAPVSTPLIQQRPRTGAVTADTGDGVRHFGTPDSPPQRLTSQLAHLFHARPIEVLVQHCAAGQFAMFHPSMSFVERRGVIAFFIHLTLLREGEKASAFQLKRFCCCTALAEIFIRFKAAACFILVCTFFKSYAAVLTSFTVNSPRLPTVRSDGPKRHVSILAAR